ncbi:uncharacterized protein [Coffea arabica]|uniref:Uncharacterized protein isoform X1 n=1 Tax=Coffea arabica TaxID=13443 RepID=A0A6P6TXU1_COFAR|nr:uncharacterized protein LOC113705510 isoform X1 [Coffea arabica]
MGSGSSKQNVASSSSSSPSPSQLHSPSPPLTSPSVRRSRSYRNRGVFNSSCLRSQHQSDSHNADQQMFDNKSKRNGFDGCCANGTMPGSNEVKTKCCRKVKVQQPDELNCVTSSMDSDEWDQSRGSRMSRAFSSRGLNPSSRFLSRLNILPGHISFRMNRANSLGSARPYFASSTSFQMSNNEDEPSTSGSMIDENDRIHNHNHFPRCFSSRSAMSPGEDLGTGDFLQSTSTPSAAREGVDPGVDSGENSFSRNRAYSEGTEEGLANRRIASEETVEQNVRFSRTLSVGRLRDRVLRRTSFPDFAFGPLEQDRETEHASQVSEGRILGAGRRPTSAEENSDSQASSSRSRADASGSLHRHNGDTPRPREARYHDLLEYRSNFLERRRRIRSQVRALQRLGSRFENLSGHERSCILSGQHRRGHCTCRINPREAESNDETSARASISRIVMLAEALFEVLDEIHQQSVVLSSRPSMSSLGSVPAPNEVVDSLPLRLYSKLQKHLQDEVAQCYICLVEYEEGDSVRVLPCRHEYHKACIDKWLKEIHRVCPLCRGDVCRSDPLPANI